MALSKLLLRNLFVVLVLFIMMTVAFLFFMQKEDKLNLLYATHGETYDTAAFGNFQQSLQANLRVDRKSLGALSLRELQAYDTIYLDPGLLATTDLTSKMDQLTNYVKQGGHLFLENGFAPNFPPALIGAQQIVKIPSASGAPSFVYPDTDVNLSGVQLVFKLFTDSYFKRRTMEDLPGFDWGYGVIPSTGKSLVTMENVSLVTINRVGNGSVLLSSSFMPNRYFPTGYDLQSGMDPAQGFPKLIEKFKAETKKVPGTAYFNKRELPLEPYFNFEFAAANSEFRSAYLGFVSKEKLGYSIKKVLGPNGRPAMAFQNHFEAMPAIQHQDGIRWAELLRTYHEVPSFTLVRSSFNWGQWRESLTAQLNVGTNAQPQFVGELPESGYSSGLHLLSGGKPLRLALYPDYRDLAGLIELPYRAYPALADVNGDGRPDLVVGSADGFVYTYTNLGPSKEAYANEPPPKGAASPDIFGEAQKLQLESGTPLQLGAYASVHVADVNGDGLPDLLVSDESGEVRLLPGRSGGKFGPPAALRAGGKGKLQVHGPAAVDVADVNGDGVPDLVVGDADGRVHLFAGIRGSDGLRFAAGRELFRLPAGALYAAPSVRDMNGDGRPDLVVGSNEGDLQVFLQDAGGSWTNRGPLEGYTLNQMGNKALVAGHNSVPLWYDINHDGKDDLLVGGVEFGSPVTIDNPQFPYQTELKAFITYAHDHFLKLDPHIFVHSFKSDEQEREEIGLHKQAFQKLGIPWTNLGTNQHTWRINYPDRQQTLLNEQAEGMWFNFGFLPAHSPVDSRPESIWSLPFILQEEKGASSSPMLIHSPTPVLRIGQNATTDIFESMAKLDMPIDYFEHIEYHFTNPLGVGDLKQFASYFDQLRTEQDYNFMSETQMAQSFLTALKGKVIVSRSWGVYLLDKLKDKLAVNSPHWHAKLIPITSELPGQAGEYAITLGVVIEKGSKFASYSMNSDSDIFMQKEGNLYVGVFKPAAVMIQPSKDRMHLMRSNVPFTIEKNNQHWSIDLKSSGMQQIKLYSPQELAIEGSDLEIAHDEASHTYTITRYGDKTSLTISQKAK